MIDDKHTNDSQAKTAIDLRQLSEIELSEVIGGVNNSKENKKEVGIQPMYHVWPPFGL